MKQEMKLKTRQQPTSSCRVSSYFSSMSVHAFMKRDKQLCRAFMPSYTCCNQPIKSIAQSIDQSFHQKAIYAK